MKERNYLLSKYSKPGFELSTDSISIVSNILDTGVCSMCKENEMGHTDMNFYDELHESRNKLYIQHDGFRAQRENSNNILESIDMLLVNELLGTSCGAEYGLEINDTTQEEQMEIVGKHMKNYKDNLEFINGDSQ